MIPGLPADLSDPFLWGLACAALQPGLRSVLAHNCPPAILLDASEQLKQMLEVVDGRKVLMVHLGSSETEDDLWGTLSPQSDEKAQSFAWQPGRLTSSPTDQHIRLIVIPNLNLLSMSAARACVALMGTEIAYLERHGQDITWVPHYFWLAGCSMSDLNQVSSHLLDRFALRLPKPETFSSDRALDIIHSMREQSTTIGTTPSATPYRHVVLSPDIQQRLRDAVHCHPVLDGEGFAHILQYFSPRLGARREIALARLTVAHARLIKAERATATHVDTAAELIGLRLDSPEKDSGRPLFSSPVDKTDGMGETPPPGSPSPGEGITDASQTLVYPPDTQEILSPAPLSASSYVEDTLPKNQEIAALQLKPVGYRAAMMRNGAIIGTERATDLQDVALVSTLLEAAKFQVIRHDMAKDTSLWNVFDKDQILLLASDLRTYRRAPIPKQMFVLVLDYTCLHDCQWKEAIIPHLQWAYTERASICLIQVGIATTDKKEALYARQIMASSISTPRFRSAFGMAPGKATPLAHGLELARRTLVRVLQSDRSKVQQARLVVLSDGRGNVPLKASLSGVIEWPVNREGIENALEVARQIGNMRNVETFVLNPQPQPYASLPIAFAEAMGAFSERIPLSHLEGSENG